MKKLKKHIKNMEKYYEKNIMKKYYEKNIHQKIPKICLVTDGTMAVPPVKGGAVSTLIKFLADENEKYHRADLFIISVFDQDARNEADSYKNSKFIFFRESDFLEKKLELISRLLNKASKVIRHDEINAYSSFYRRCVQYVREINPDFIVCEGGPMVAAFHCFSKYFPPEKMCLHLHGKWRPSRLVSSMFGHVMSCSKFIEDEYKRTCTNSNVHYGTVYNCADNLRFRNRLSEEERMVLRKKLGFGENDFVILFCGRICPDKGVKELINAVLMSGSRVKALIIGSVNFGRQSRKDAYQEEISKMAEDNPVKIKVTGYIPNEDVWRYHQCGDCMAVPSIWDEPASLSLIEGLTSGLPVVVTRSGGNPEEANEKCACMIDRGEGMVKRMSDAFDSLSGDPERTKMMGRESVIRSEYFSMEKYYKDYHDFFAEGFFDL